MRHVVERRAVSNRREPRVHRPFSSIVTQRSSMKTKKAKHECNETFAVKVCFCFPEKECQLASSSCVAVKANLAFTFSLLFLPSNSLTDAKWSKSPSTSASDPVELPVSATLSSSMVSSTPLTSRHIELRRRSQMSFGND